MSIIRVKKDKNNPYLIMNKTSINDKRLSLKAKGLHCFLLSKPDNWYIDTRDIVSNNSNGRDSVLSSINELVKYGYMYKHRFRNNDGTFNSYNYLVYENPHGIPHTKPPAPPQTDFPILDRPITDNHTLLINKRYQLIKEAASKNLHKSNKKSNYVAYSIKTPEETILIQLLNSLHIINYKIFFDSFSISDILTYANWVKERNCTMVNPTGFLYTALKDRWMDNIVLESQDPKSRLFYYRCFECGKVYGYPDLISDYHLCNKCEGSE